MAIRVQREVLAEMLRSHGEDELAERLASLSDDERARIGRLGAYYAWSEDAMKLGISLGGARALSLAAIDVLEKPDEGSVATSRMPSAPKATQNSRQSAGELAMVCLPRDRLRQQPVGLVRR